MPNQVNIEKNWDGKQYQEKQIEIVEKVSKLKSRGSDMRSDWEETSVFEADERYFFWGFRTEKDKIQTDSRKDVEINEFTIRTYGGDKRHFKNFKVALKFS